MVTSEEIADVVQGRTIPSAFVETVAAHGSRVALRGKNDDDSWGEWTFDEYADRVARAAAGMADLGVVKGDRVALMVRNVAEFHVLDVAAYFLGATPVSIYNSSAPEQVEYLIGHCEAKIAIAETPGLLENFLKVREQLPALEHLGIITDPEGTAGDDVFTYEALLDHEPIDLTVAASVASPDDLATIIYTSGTTGPPKGVMITHFNVSWTIESLRRCIDLDSYVGLRLVSYLPMAHIAERIVSHYQQVYLAYEVTCCPDPGALAAYVREVRPEVMFGVPRVWEKFQAGVMGALAGDPEKQAGFNSSVAAARPIVEAMDWDRATEEQLATFGALDEAAFKGIREMLGLDALQVAITGAAPIPAELLGWYRAIGVPLSEIYGMSETSGPMTYIPTRVKPGSVGPAIPGCEVKLAEEDNEIICRGGNIFVGYLDAPDKTAEALDEDGWLHSGDIGEVDDDGYFTIVDRKKELIITAGGKNLSPANLEANLKLIPLVGQACAIGDDRPFVSALVVLDSDVAPAWAEQHGIEFDTLEELARHDDVIAEINDGVTGAMADFNNAEKVKKVCILGTEWLPDSEELTPTSKLKRRGIHQRYAEEIESIYA